MYVIVNFCLELHQQSPIGIGEVSLGKEPQEVQLYRDIRDNGVNTTRESNCETLFVLGNGITEWKNGKEEAKSGWEPLKRMLANNSREFSLLIPDLGKRDISQPDTLNTILARVAYAELISRQIFLNKLVFDETMLSLIGYSCLAPEYSSYKERIELSSSFREKIANAYKEDVDKKN